MATELIDQIKEETAIMKVSREAVSLCDRVTTLIVKDQATYDNATDIYKALVAMEKEIKETHEKVIRNWFEKHRAACADRDKDLKPVTAAKVIAKSKAATWADEQERIRQEAERKAREEAYRLHQEEEIKARAEAARIAAESARIEEEARLALAAEAEQSGATAAQVNEILDTPVYIAPEPAPYVPPAYVAPSVAPSFQKAAGFAPRWNYKGRLVNLHALVQAAQANPYLETYIEGNESEINALARRMEDAFQLPGCILDKKRV